MINLRFRHRKFNENVIFEHQNTQNFMLEWNLKSKWWGYGLKGLVFDILLPFFAFFWEGIFQKLHFWRFSGHPGRRHRPLGLCNKLLGRYGESDAAIREQSLACSLADNKLTNCNSVINFLVINSKTQLSERPKRELITVPTKAKNLPARWSLFYKKGPPPRVPFLPKEMLFKRWGGW